MENSARETSMPPDRVIALVQGVLAELGSERTVALSSRLVEDLGLDSLARGELLRRLEREVGGTLDEERIAKAKTVKDLVASLGIAADSSMSQGFSSGDQFRGEGTASPMPSNIKTLVEAVQWQMSRNPAKMHVTLFETSRAVSYQELWELSSVIACGLLAHGLTAGGRVAIVLPTGLDFLTVYLGTLQAGGVPVPLYPPHTFDGFDQYLRRQTKTLDNAAPDILVLPSELEKWKLVGQALLPRGAQILTPISMQAWSTPLKSMPDPAPDDLALIQYTSGSTGSPKGVALTHAHLVSNLRAMAEAAGVNSDDRIVSWLPLYHDMGLIGAWLGSLVHGAPLLLMSPLHFLARPSRWLQAISSWRGTISAGPNFAYQLCADRVVPEEINGIDLSVWRSALNGAEPVSPHTLRKFSAKFAPFGFREEVFWPVYGLAENALGLTMPRTPRKPLIDRIQRAEVMDKQLAVPATESDDVLEVPSCGSPLPGYEIRIVDTRGKLLWEREIGNLEFKGPSASGTYFRNAEATRMLRSGEWSRSGDLAYRVGDEFFICGRTKDLIIRAGRNIFPQDLEQAISDIPGVRRGCVAAFQAQRKTPQGEMDELVIAVETKLVDVVARTQLEERVKTTLANTFDVVPDKVALIAPRTLPKTSSGKLQRSEARARYEAGVLTKPLGKERAIVAVVFSLLRSVLGRGLTTVARRTFTIYCWVVVAALWVPTLSVCACLPSQIHRRVLAAWSLRCAFFLTGITLRLEGEKLLPKSGPCILIANHSSYLDALVLMAVLPSEFCFVAKRDFAGGDFVPKILAMFGTLFVERFSARDAMQDAQEVSKAVAQGGRVVMFPEGTFGRSPGLGGFKLGAFQIASRERVPIVPCAIIGSRRTMPLGDWAPAPGTIKVQVSEPLVVPDESLATLAESRNSVRLRLMKLSGEPDAELRGREHGTP